MRLRGGGGEALSPRLITPLIACQVLTQQYSRPLPSSCPSTPHPLPRSAGEEVTRSQTRPHRAICSVTSIKSCTAKEPRGLLTPPTAALMDGAAIWFNSRSAQALQEDLTSLRLNNGPGVDGWVGMGGGREEINAL